MVGDRPATVKSLRVGRAADYSVIPAFPRNMLLSLTNTCNHKCIFCSYRKNIPKPVVMPKEKAFDILTQAYNLGLREVGFYLVSEPFMSRDLESCVAYSKKIGYEYVYLTTNGAMATKDRMKKLLLGGLNSIKFSINAGTVETYRKIHGKNDFERVIQNVIDADILRKELKLDVAYFAYFVETNINKGEYNLLKDILNDVVDRFYITPAITMVGGQDDIVSPKKKGMGLQNESWWGNKEGGTKKICPQIFNRICVTAEGFLTACCVDVRNEVVYADLNKVSLKEAWHNEKICALRYDHLIQSVPQDCLCYNCMNNTDDAVKPLCEWASNQKGL